MLTINKLGRSYNQYLVKKDTLNFKGQFAPKICDETKLF